jgi:hypothetical protein
VPLRRGMPGRCPGDSPFDRRREAASVPRRQVQGMGPSQQTGVRGQARRLYGLRTVRPGMSGSTRHQVEAQDLGLKGAVLLLYDSPDTVPPGQLIMRLDHYGSEPSEFDFQRPVGADLSNCGSLGGEPNDHGFVDAEAEQHSCQPARSRIVRHLHRTRSTHREPSRHKRCGYGTFVLAF